MFGAIWWPQHYTSILCYFFFSFYTIFKEINKNVVIFSLKISFNSFFIQFRRKIGSRNVFNFNSSI